MSFIKRLTNDDLDPALTTHVVCAHRSEGLPAVSSNDTKTATKVGETAVSPAKPLTPLRKEALAFLDQHNDLPPVDWHHFAYLHNTHIIAKTAFDKGEDKNLALKAYKETSEYLAKHPPLFTQKQGNLEVVSMLSNVSALQKLLPPSQLGHTSSAVLEQAVDASLKELHTQLDKNGFAYAIYGYEGKYEGDGPGHSIGFKFVKEDKTLTVIPCNLGEGCERHAEVDVKGTHYKISYAYSPVVLTLEEWNQRKTVFMSHLIRYVLDTPEAIAPGYKGEEIYDLLALLGPSDLAYVTKQGEKLAGHAQIVGSCVPKAVRILVMDYLLMQKGVEKEEMHVFFLNLHLTSLIAAYKSYNPSHLQHRLLLRNAASEFGLFLKRHEAILDPAEFLKGAEIVDIILETTQTAPIGVSPPTASFTPKTTFLNKEGLPFLEKHQNRLCLENKPKSSVYTPFPPFRPTTFKEDLRKFIESKETPSTFAYSCIIQSVAAWPIPRWNDPQDPWDLVPLEHVIAIVEQFFALIEIAHVEPVRCVPHLQDTLLFFTLYAITDKLVRRIPETLLKGFVSPFSLKEIENMLILASPQEGERYDALKLYFSSQKGKVIFPIEEQLDLRTYLSEKNAGKQSQGANHLTFLSQFQTQAPQLADYHALWHRGGPAALGPVLDLYYMAYAAEVKAFNGRQIIRNRMGFINAVRNPASLWMALCEKTYSVTDHALIPEDEAEHFCLFLEEHKNLTTNQALLLPKISANALGFKEEVNQAEIYRELLIVLRHPKLKIALAMQWIKNNWKHLDVPAVQRVLSCCFFSPQALQDHLTVHPGFIEEFRALIEKGMTQISQNSPSFLFLMEVAIRFEVFVASSLKKPLHFAILKQYQAKLLAQLALYNPEEDSEHFDAHEHTLLKLTHLHSLLARSATTEEEFITYYVSAFRYALQNSPQKESGSLFAKKQSYLHTLWLHLNAFLTSKGENRQLSLTTIFNGVMAQVLPFFVASKATWKAENDRLIHSDGYTLDLEECRIYHSKLNRPLLYRDPSLKAATLAKGLGSEKYWWGGNVSEPLLFLSLDEKNVFIRRADPARFGQALDRAVMWSHQEESVQFIHYNSEQTKDLYFLNALPLIYTLIQTDMAAKKIVVHGLRAQGGAPFIEIEYSDKEITVSKLDKKGKKLPFALANLEDLPPTSDLYPFTLRFARFNQQLCFVDTQNKIQELYFTNLGLSFKRTDKGELESNEFPGFAWTPQTVLELGEEASKEAIVLSNGRGILKVIVLAPTKEYLALGHKKQKVLAQVAPCSYVSYDLASSTSKIEAKILFEHLFLIYALKTGGHFTKAYQHLQETHFALPFDENCFRVLDLMLELKDRSAKALAFTMQLVLWVTERCSTQKLEQRKLFRNFLEKGMRLHIEYLRAMDDETLGSIPRRYRLAPEDERRILAAYESENLPQYSILRIRKRLYTSNLAVVDFLSAVQLEGPRGFERVYPPSLITLDALPASPSPSIPWIEHPIRVPGGYLTIHFERLYNLAKTASPGKWEPFDFMLLAFLKESIKEGNDRQVASLLFWVRQFPAHFATLDLKEGATFTDIRRAVNRLPHQSLSTSASSSQVEVYNSLIVARKDSKEALARELSSAFGTVTRFLGFGSARAHESAKKTKIFDPLLLKKPQALEKFLSDLLKNKEHLLIESSDYEKIAPFVKPPHSVTHFEGPATLEGLHKAARHQRTLVKRKAPPFPSVPLLLLENIEKKPFAKSLEKAAPKETVVSLEEFNGAIFKAENFTSVFEKEIFLKLVNAQEKLKTKRVATYQLTPASLSHVHATLTEKQSQIQEQIKKLRAELKEMLNRPYQAFKLAPEGSPQERAFQLSLNAKQTYIIEPEQIIEDVLLRNEMDLLVTERPMLGPKEHQTILELAHRLNYLKALEKMGQVALTLTQTLRREEASPQERELLLALHNYFKALEKMGQVALTLTQNLRRETASPHEHERLLALLNYEFLFEPTLYPEILFFMTKTGIFPTPEQLSAYFFACEGLEKNEHRSFQLPAGGGKTTVMAPLLKLRCRRYKAMVVNITTPAIYAIEKEVFGKTLHLLGEKLAHFDVDIHKQLSLEQLKSIYDDIQTYPSKRKGIIITPTTFYAFRLICYGAAFDPEEAQKADVVVAILNFLQQHAICFIDESHRNLNPNTKAVYGIGEFQALIEEERALLFQLMKPLLGIENVPVEKPLHPEEASQATQQALRSFVGENAALVSSYLTEETTVATLSGLRTGSKNVPTQDEIVRIQKALALYLSNLMLQHFPLPTKIALTQYWTNKALKMPSLPATVTAKEKSLLALAQFALCDLIPHVLKTKTDFDHVSMLDIDTPAYHKVPSFAQFKDPFMALMLTIKGTFERGLSPTQFERLITQMQVQDGEEQVFGSDFETPTSRLFETWVKGMERPVSLRGIKVRNKEKMEALHLFMKDKDAVIEWYLNVQVLPTIGTSSEQFTSTPAHLLNGFKCTCIFSATPLLAPSYPRSLGETKPDTLFEAEVVLRACQKSNQNFHFPTSFEGFFEEMRTQKESFATITALIDAGGFFAAETNRNVAKTWLLSSSLDAILFFAEKHSGSNEQEGFLLLVKEEAECCLISKDALGYLEAHKALKVGTYYDSAHTESANVAQKSGTRAVVFAGDTLTLSHAIQSIMRLRGFLKEEMQQTIAWAIPPKLAEKIKSEMHTATVSAEALFAYTIKREAAENISGHILGTFQEIAYRIENLVLSESTHLRKTILERAKGFKERVNPRALLMLQESIEDSEKVLHLYARTLYEHFHEGVAHIAYDAIDITNARPSSQTEQSRIELKKAIVALIAEVKAKKILKIRVDADQGSSSEMFQTMMVAKVTQKTHVSVVDRRKLAAAATKEPRAIVTEDYAKGVRNKESASSLFDPHLSRQLFFEANQLHTASELGRPLLEKFLKSIDFLVISPHGNTFFAEAICNDSVLPLVLGGKIPPDAFIIGGDGVPFFLKTGASSKQREQIERILKSPEMGDVLDDVTLLNGRLPTSDRFNERVKKWNDFSAFWLKILQSRTKQTQIDQTALKMYATQGRYSVENLIIYKKRI